MNQESIPTEYFAPPARVLIHVGEDGAYEDVLSGRVAVHIIDWTYLADRESMQDYTMEDRWHHWFQAVAFGCPKGTTDRLQDLYKDQKEYDQQDTTGDRRAALVWRFLPR